MESCYAYVTLMLQCCYKKRRNNSVMPLKRFCNILIVPLQARNGLASWKKKKQKNSFGLSNGYALSSSHCSLHSSSQGLESHSPERQAPPFPSFSKGGARGGLSILSQPIYAFLYINNVGKTRAFTKTPFYVKKKNILEKKLFHKQGV